MKSTFEKLANDVEEGLGNVENYIKEGLEESFSQFDQSDIGNQLNKTKEILSSQLPKKLLPPISSLTPQDAEDNRPYSGSPIEMREEGITVPKSETVAINKAGKRKTLSHGRFVGNPSAFSEKEALGPSCRFVFVPSGWRTESEGEYLPTLFKAMGIPFPSVTFVLEKSSGSTCPGLGARINGLTDGNEVIEVIEDNPSEEEKNLFSLLMQSRMAAIMEAVSTASVQCDAIYYMKFPYIENEFCETALDNLAPGGVALSTFPLDSWLSEESSKLFDPNLIAKSIVNIEDEIEVAVKWGPPPNDYSQVLRKITHICIFESRADHEYFESLVEREIPQGIMAAAGTNPVLDAALQAMKQGRPVFIFKHTMRSGYLLSKLIEFYDSKDSNKHTLLQEALCDPKNKILYDIWGQMGHREPMDRRVMKLAYNRPPSFNRKAVLVVDPLLETDPNKLLDDISILIASVYDSVVELGGNQAENRLFQQAIMMDYQLRVLMRNERAVANFLKTLIVFITFLTTILACTVQYFRYETPDENDDAVATLNVLTIILPICLGICVTVMAAFSPISRLAILKYLRARLKQEMFKYRCHIGSYRVRSKLGAVHRKIFGDNLRKLWDELMTSELMKGSIDNNMRVYPEQDDDINPNDRQFPLTLGGGFPSWTYEWLCRSPQNYQRQIDQYELEPLSSEDYIKMRVDRAIARYREQIPQLSWEMKWIQFSIILISSAGTILAAYELQLWIPVLLAAVAALQAYTEYTQTAIKLKSMNVASAKLKQILYWWTSLSLMQQRMPKMKQTLVENVETVILDQLRLLIEQDLESKEEDRRVDLHGSDQAEHESPSTVAMSAATKPGSSLLL